MKTILLALVLIPLISFGQLNQSNALIYSGINYMNPSSGSHSISPIIGLYLNDKKGNLNNFEVHNLSLDKTNITSASSIGLAYYKAIILNKKSEEKFQFGVGLGGSLNYGRYVREATTTSTFRTSTTTIGLGLSIKPLVNYAITDNLFIGFTPTLHFMDQYFLFQSYENPAIPIEQQKITTLNFLTSNPLRMNFDFRIGIRLK